MKIGLEYFAFDIDFFENDKIEFLGARYGLPGESIAVRLLCRIYRGKGYYCPWGPDEALLFAKRAGGGCDPALVGKVVAELVRRNFFDRKTYEKYGVLTSPEIQRRYIEATCKRNRVALRADLLLTDPGNRPNIVLTDASGGIIAENDARRPQSKAEESNVIPSVKTDGDEPPARDEKRNTGPAENEKGDAARESKPAGKPDTGTKEEKGCAEKEEKKGTVAAGRFFEVLTAEGTRRDAVCRRFGLDAALLGQQARRFCEKLESDGCLRKPRTDLIRHFNNWLNLELARTSVVREPPAPATAQARQIIYAIKMLDRR